MGSKSFDTLFFRPKPLTASSVSSSGFQASLRSTARLRSVWTFLAHSLSSETDVAFATMRKA
jgi:hypothetical protein